MPAVIKEGEVVEVSNYIKCDVDLMDKDGAPREFTLTIDHAETQDVALPGKSPTPTDLLYFVGAKKPLILNTTKKRVLVALFGRKVSGWAGKTVIMYPSTAKLRGKSVPAVRLCGVNGEERV